MTKQNAILIIVRHLFPLSKRLIILVNVSKSECLQSFSLTNANLDKKVIKYFTMLQRGTLCDNAILSAM